MNTKRALAAIALAGAALSFSGAAHASAIADPVPPSVGLIPDHTTDAPHVADHWDWNQSADQGYQPED